MAVKTLCAHNDTTPFLKDAKGRRPLHYAATNGHIDCAMTLLDVGTPEIDAQDDRGQTALHKAAAAGYSELVEELLERGADPLLTDTKGRTAACVLPPLFLDPPLPAVSCAPLNCFILVIWVPSLFFGVRLYLHLICPWHSRSLVCVLLVQIFGVSCR
jgi:hypothetical protein